jgi:DNA repair ATPase RecN
MDMSWVSLLEDDDKLRTHWAAVNSTIGGLKAWANDSKFVDPGHAEFRTSDLSARISTLVKDFEKVLDRLYKNAEERLKDPGVRLIKQLDKKTANLQKNQTDLRKATNDLVESRAKCDQLRGENKALKKQIEHLSSERRKLAEEVAGNLAWKAEVSGTRRIKN